jgi:hypothetical protein
MDGRATVLTCPGSNRDFVPIPHEASKHLARLGFAMSQE